MDWESSHGGGGVEDAQVQNISERQNHLIFLAICYRAHYFMQLIYARLCFAEATGWLYTLKASMPPTTRYATVFYISRRTISRLR